VPSGPVTGRRVAAALAAYAVLAGVVVAWGWMLTHSWRAIGGPDDDVSRWFADQRTGALDQVADVGTLLGETVVGLGVAAVVAVVAGLALRSVLAAAVVLVADAGDGAIYWLASHADPRDRPPVQILDAGLVPDHSFPSGHVGTATAVYGGAALLLAVWLRRRGHRGPGWLLVGALALLPAYVALSRLYQGAHHLTDVATSLAYGAVWLVVLAAALRLWSVRGARVPGSSGGLPDPPVPHR